MSRSKSGVEQLRNICRITYVLWSESIWNMHETGFRIGISGAESSLLLGVQLPSDRCLWRDITWRITRYFRQKHLPNSDCSSACLVFYRRHLWWTHMVISKANGTVRADGWICCLCLANGMLAQSGCFSYNRLLILLIWTRVSVFFFELLGGGRTTMRRPPVVHAIAWFIFIFVQSDTVTNCLVL